MMMVQVTRLRAFWKVAVIIDNKVCGGAIIDAWHVLTSTECIFGKDRQGWNDGRGITVHGRSLHHNGYGVDGKTVERYIVHPEFQKTGSLCKKNDIAIIKVSYNRKKGLCKRVCAKK